MSCENCANTVDLMAKVVEVEIPVELCEYIEALQYECNARQNLVAWLLDRGVKGTPQYDAYHKDYVEKYTEYSLAQQELTEKYIKPKYPNSTWRLDFATHIATVTLG